MNINQLKESRFLKKEDVGQGALVTVREVHQENVAKEGVEPEMKWCISFDELEKPMVLNSTNGQLIARITGQDDTDHWVGAKIVLYDDPSVSFGGKVTGGIRCRAPRGKASSPVPSKPAPRPLPAPVKVQGHNAPPSDQSPIDNDDVPF